MLLCLMSCQDIRTGMGWMEGVKKGEEREQGQKEKRDKQVKGSGKEKQERSSAELLLGGRESNMIQRQEGYRQRKKIH